MRSLIPAALLLSACSAEPPPAGSITAEEDRQLNDAAASLDANAAAPEDAENSE